MEDVKEAPIKVLYVEDDLVDQKAFQRYVSRNGYNFDCELASSVEEAKKKLSTGNYDVVITDYLLNNETGFSIIDSVKDTPVIFTTGQGNQEIAVKAMKKGVFDYILKESNNNYLDLLTTTIEKAYAYGSTHKKLEEAEEKIKKLVWALGQIKNAITILTSDGKVEWINKGCEDLFGYTFEEMKNKSIFNFRAKDIDAAKIEAITSNLLTHKKVLTSETQIVNKMGRQCWIYTTITPIADNEGKITRIIIVDTDITEKKKIEEELISAKEKAEAAAVTKQQFLANMSHEIRTPINAIMGIMHMLETTNQAETRKKYLKLVQNASNNLLNIINDILDMSKLEAGKMTLEKIDFNIRELINNLRKSMKYRAEEKGLELKSDVDEEVPDYLKGDSSRLNQILMNLLGNAIKFTEKGSISISVKLVKEDGQNVTIQFSVSDTGIGIAKEDQAHMFEHFHQVHSDASRKYGGTGLGLAIVKRLTELQHGKVWLESKVNEGSKFFVEIPMQIGSMKEKESEKRVTQKSGKFLEGKHILLVEDEILNQMVAKHLLENELGAKVEIASNGKIAIDKLEHASYDLVIMDIQMPEMNGYDTTRHIRHKMAEPKSKTPILAMTAHAFQEEKIKCKEAGMDEFISKPIRIAELKQKLQHMLLP